MKNLLVTTARHLGNYRVEITFNDGKITTVDFEDFLIHHPHPTFSKHLNVKEFKRFKIEDGNLVWGKNWDLIFSVDQLHRGRIRDGILSNRIRRVEELR